MWGNYQQKGEILQKAGLHSVDAHGAMENFGMYVSADIATSFTLLVGIFFPSATGMPPDNPDNPNIATTFKVLISVHEKRFSLKAT